MMRSPVSMSTSWKQPWERATNSCQRRVALVVAGGLEKRKFKVGGAHISDPVDAVLVNHLLRGLIRYQSRVPGSEVKLKTRAQAQRGGELLGTLCQLKHTSCRSPKT